MSETVPQSIIEALTGYPDVGVTESIIPLLTVDGAGYPNVCLLSRAQLDADSDHVYAIVAGSTTKQNILRDRRSTLVVFTTRAAYYCKMDVDSLSEIDGSLCVVFSITTTKVDGDGSIPMEPLRYVPTNEVKAFEDWEGSIVILADLRQAFGSS